MVDIRESRSKFISINAPEKTVAEDTYFVADIVDSKGYLFL